MTDAFSALTNAMMNGANFAEHTPMGDGSERSSTPAGQDARVPARVSVSARAAQEPGRTAGAATPAFGASPQGFASGLAASASPLAQLGTHGANPTFPAPAAGARLLSETEAIDMMATRGWAAAEPQEQSGGGEPVPEAAMANAPTCSPLRPTAKTTHMCRPRASARKAP